MNEATIKTLTLIGFLISTLVGVAALYVGIRNSKKTIFINAITTSRIKYIQDLRNAISEYCGLVYTYHCNAKIVPMTAFEIRNKYDKLIYLIGLYLNIEDDYFDPKILKTCRAIRDIKDGTPLEEVEEQINSLIETTQYLLKYEWEGAKMESQKGILSRKMKKKLYDTHILLHQRHQMEPDRKPFLVLSGVNDSGKQISLTILNNGGFATITKLNVLDGRVEFNNIGLPVRLGNGDSKIFKLTRLDTNLFAKLTDNFEFEIIYKDLSGKNYNIKGESNGLEGKLNKY